MNRIIPAVLLIFLAGCTCRVKAPVNNSVVKYRDSIGIYHHPLDLRFSVPKNGSDILVIYATGDGGWRPLDSYIFDWISSWGYPAAGFSSKNYLKNLEYIGNTTTPGRLVRDYEEVIRFTEQRLGIPETTRVVLVGLSRGAGLAIVAAGEGGLKSNLAGVVAIALTKEEEHVVYYRSQRRSPKNQPKLELLTIQTYEYLPRIDSVPVVVLQSTHDSYLPAAGARLLFGPDTEMKKLIPIQASNHRFTGGCLDLYAEIGKALAWISSTGAVPQGTRGAVSGPVPEE